MEIPKTVRPAITKKPHYGVVSHTTKGSQPEKEPRPNETKKKKILSWDEHAIEEHDQLRGTRMKIEEPNTPYTHYDHTKDDGDEVSLRSHSPSEHMKDRSKLCWETLEKKTRNSCRKSSALILLRVYFIEGRRDKIRF